MGRSLAGLLLILAGMVFPSSLDFLAPFWGSDLSPVDTAASGFTLQVDQFTEYDGDTLRFPMGRKSDTCSSYCETIGFNTLGFHKSRGYRGDTWMAWGVFGGMASDAVSGFLQNDYKHLRKGANPVPREGVREGVLFGASLAADWGFPTVENLFYGGGLLGNNVYSETYLHLGIRPQRTAWPGRKFGIKYFAVTRVGAVLKGREYLIFGSPYFGKLYPFHSTTQAEAGLFLRWGTVPIEVSWRGSYATGVFVNPETGKPVPMLLEGLKTVIWKLSFERYNDALNGTDYGPTYGIKLIGRIR